MLFYPSRWRLLLLVVSLGAGLLRPAAGRAQVPALLLGQGEKQQISFVANQTVPPGILARMDSPAVAELNQEMAGGTAHLVVELRPGGKQFTVVHEGQPDHIETGTYVVRGKTLVAQSLGTEGGSSFDKQALEQLSYRRLGVEFLVGDELPGAFKEVAYRRVQ